MIFDLCMIYFVSGMCLKMNVIQIIRFSFQIIFVGINTSVYLYIQSRMQVPVGELGWVGWYLTAEQYLIGNSMMWMLQIDLSQF